MPAGDAMHSIALGVVARQRHRVGCMSVARRIPIQISNSPNNFVLATLARPRFAAFLPRPPERAHGTPGARCTLGLCARCRLRQGNAPRTFGFTGNTRRSARSGLNGLLRVTPGNRPLRLGSPLQGTCRRHPSCEDTTLALPHGARRCAGITRLGPYARWCGRQTARYGHSFRRTKGTHTSRSRTPPASTASRPAVVTIALAPLIGAGQGGLYAQ